MANRKGSVLPMVVLTTVILLMAGLSLVQLGSNAQMMAARTSQEIAARAAADAGVNRALYEMNKNVAGGVWDFRDVMSSARESLGQLGAGYAYTIDEATRGSTYAITSVGSAGLAHRQISVNVRKQGWFECAIVASGYARPKHPKPKGGLPASMEPPKKKGGKLSIKNYSIEGYSSRLDVSPGPVEIKTNSSHKHAVKLDGDIVVTSDVAVGPGAKPERCIEKKNGAEIDGRAYAASEQAELVPSIAPEGLSTRQAQEYKYGEGKPLSGMVAYSKFELPNGKVQRVSGDCTVYVAGEMKIEDDAQLIVPRDSSLTLYVGGMLEVKKNGQITNEARDPARLVIYGTATCEKIRIDSSGHDFYGAIYAPWAKVEIKHAGDIYGAVAGWDVKLATDKEHPGTFYFDEALRGRGTVRFVATGWQEN